MKVTALGTGTGLPDPNRGPAGFLVQTHSGTFLLDGGSGTLQKLAQVECNPVLLTAGIYSHWHPDHCSDLVPLLFAMHGYPGRQNDYPIFAGHGFAHFLDALHRAYGRWIEPRGGRVQVTECSTSTLESQRVFGIELTTAPAVHTAGSLHIKIHDLKTNTRLVYSGDTAPSQHLVHLARDADLLICECAGSDASPIRGHMTPNALRELIEVARPKQVWITHLYPGVTNADITRALQDLAVPWCRPDDLQQWTYSHSMVAGGFDEMS